MPTLTLEDEFKLEAAALALVRRLLSCPHAALVSSGTCRDCGAWQSDDGGTWRVPAFLQVAADSGYFANAAEGS